MAVPGFDTIEGRSPPMIPARLSPLRKPYKMQRAPLLDSHPSPFLWRDASSGPIPPPDLYSTFSRHVVPTRR